MAATVQSIALATKYAAILDEVYKRESLTTVLDTPSDLVMFDGANAAKIFKTSMDGLGDYSRNNGFAKGAVVGTWETHTLAYDRGRSFLVDSQDNEETLDLAFGTLASEFVRTKEVPEGDAYCFAKIAGTANIQAATPANFANITNVLTAVDTAQAALDAEEVPMEGRVLFVSTQVYYALKDKLTRMIQNGDQIINRNFRYLDDTLVIPVPAARFNTKIDLYDGVTNGEEAGGYGIVPAVGSSYAINFMLVHPSAIIKVVKHHPLRIFSPDVVQDADAWRFNARIYGDTFVKENKVKGIYLHRASSANS